MCSIGIGGRDQLNVALPRRTDVAVIEPVRTGSMRALVVDYRADSRGIGIAEESIPKNGVETTELRRIKG